MYIVFDTEAKLGQGKKSTREGGYAGAWELDAKRDPRNTFSSACSQALLSTSTTVCPPALSLNIVVCLAVLLRRGTVLIYWRKCWCVLHYKIDLSNRLVQEALPMPSLFAPSHLLRLLPFLPTSSSFSLLSQPPLLCITSRLIHPFRQNERRTYLFDF